MQFRSKKDGTHFPLTHRAASLDEFASLQGQESARKHAALAQTDIRKPVKVANDRIKELRLQAFLHHFAKYADPNGLAWLIGTGRSDYETEIKIANLAGYEHLQRKPIMHLINVKAYESKPNAKAGNTDDIEEYARELGTWLRERYPLYQPKKA